MEKFTGSNAALIYENKILTHLRDDKENVKFRNMWDLPGGKKEIGENPFECIKREAFEEFGIEAKESNVIFKKAYPDILNTGGNMYFFVIKIDQKDIENIKFGNEGQRWELVEISDFLKRENVIENFKNMVSDYINL